MAKTAGRFRRLLYCRDCKIFMGLFRWMRWGHRGNNKFLIPGFILMMMAAGGLWLHVTEVPLAWYANGTNHELIMHRQTTSQLTTASMPSDPQLVGNTSHLCLMTKSIEGQSSDNASTGEIFKSLILDPSSRLSHLMGGHGLILELEDVLDPDDGERDIIQRWIPEVMSAASRNNDRTMFRGPLMLATLQRLQRGLPSPPSGHDSWEWFFQRGATCVVVATGGVLLNHELGKAIDKYDLVIRVNAGPTVGFERHVGKKTHFRVLSPEASRIGPHLEAEDFTNTTFVLIVTSKTWGEWLDAVWRNMAGVPNSLFRKAGDPRLFHQHFHRFRVLHPSVPDELEKAANRQFNPTTGLAAINFALHFCQKVDIAGFSYDLEEPNARLYYYPTKETMDSMMTKHKEHNLGLEINLVRTLIQSGLVTDLTGHHAARVKANSRDGCTHQSNNNQ